MLSRCFLCASPVTRESTGDIDTHRAKYVALLEEWISLREKTIMQKRIDIVG